MDHLRFLLPYPRKAERAIPRAVQGTIYLTGRGSIPLRYRHLDGFRATAAQDFHRDGFADCIAIERGKEIQSANPSRWKSCAADLPTVSLLSAAKRSSGSPTGWPLIATRISP